MRSSEAKNCASGSADMPIPEMWGVMVGRTWSPESRTPSAGSNRQRWSWVWPGVWTATQSRPASWITSASSRWTDGLGVDMSARSVRMSAMPDWARH